MVEPVRMVLRISADHSDEGEEEQREDQNDLSSRQPEFGFSVRLDSKDVYKSARIFSVYILSKVHWMDVERGALGLFKKKTRRIYAVVS